MRWLMLLPVLIFGALAGVFYVGMMTTDPSALRSALIGQTAPGLPQERVAGTEALSDLTEGEVTLVNFWASWCPPCRAEHPNLLALEAQGIRIVGVNFRDDPDDAAAYLRDDDNPFAATSLDESGRASLDWGVAAPPETFILAADGTILYRYIGPLVGSQFEQQFRPELERAQAR
ncbi:MAG: DsbE family thiol:disulfide interchange protein [Rhodobacteraceae bacterium]|nr:DsbE family thiol:disulfide interchange protein [Paracoccaceae bacterium]